MNKKNLLLVLALLLSSVVNSYATQLAALPEKAKKHYGYYHHDLMLSLFPEEAWNEKIASYEWARKTNQHDWRQTGSSENDWYLHEDALPNDIDTSQVNLRSWLLYQKNYRAGIQIGYQQNPALATARRGSDCSYENENPGFSADAYQQQYHNPYIGFVASYVRDDLELNGVLKFSDWVKARDYNNRDSLEKISFYGSSGDARFYSVSGNAGYYLTNVTKVVVDLAYAKYDTRHTGVSARYYGPERILAFCETCAGTKSEDYIASIGLNYLF